MQRQVTKRQVQVIEARIPSGLMQSSTGQMVRKKVVAYARVSTEHEEQQSSYEAQVDYYTRMITGRSDWEFVEVYTDKGISGILTFWSTGNHITSTECMRLRRRMRRKIACCTIWHTMMTVLN